jgi:polysaccharide biosynthesis/export protein
MGYAKSWKLLSGTSAFLTGLLLLSCVAPSPNPPGNPVPQASEQLITIPAVTIASQDNGLQVSITASAPFTYTVVPSEAPLSLAVDIPHARFVDLPPVLAVDQHGVSHISLGQGLESAGVARLQVHYREKMAYSLAKERQRLVVSLRPDRAMPAAALSPAGQPTAVPAALPASAATAEEYRVGPNDVLEITVYREPDLSKRLRVTEEGSLSFPLIGHAPVAGSTPQEIEAMLAHRLAQGYLVKPQVSVQVAEYQSQQVFVLGAVQSPGQFPLRGQTTLLEMISRAGGLSHNGGQSQFLVVMRGHMPRATPARDIQTLRIDLEQLLDRGDLTLNVPLQGQDVIYVPQAAAVFVFGEVKNPGPIALAGKSMTLMEAISKAGSFTPLAAPSRTRVIRVTGGSEQSMPIDVTDIIKRGDRSKDIVLEPNDIVIVAESVF